MDNEGLLRFVFRINLRLFWRLSGFRLFGDEGLNLDSGRSCVFLDFRYGRAVLI